MIYEIVSRYHDFSLNDEHHRYKSWEHCYEFYKLNKITLENPLNFDKACLHLAFYLASWGMMRGGSFLLQKDYLIHKYLLENVLMNKEYFRYFVDRNTELTENFYEGIDELIIAIRNSYKNNITKVNNINVEVNVTDTLASKIMLGVYGNVPAYDRYFISGIKLHGLRTKFDQISLEQLVLFYNDNYVEFNKCKELFEQDGIKYTPMKLIDMYFWQVGFMYEELSEVDFDEIKAFAMKYRNNIAKIKPTILKKISGSRIGLTDEIRVYISKRLSAAKEEGLDYLELRSGTLHNEMNLSNRMPSVCSAMESIDGFRLYEIISDTPSGKSSTRVFKYKLF